MYKSFYNLDQDPFVSNFDLAYLWLGEKHKEVLSTLRYGVLDNKGFLLLTGHVGTGKTMLINAMTQSFDADVEWAVVSDPTIDRIDFYNAIAKGFGLDKQFTSKVQFLIQFSHFLHKADDDKKKVVLIVDECHLLNQEMLEELRLLSNIEKADTKLINIFFVGQPEFTAMLIQPENRAVRQRLTLKSELNSLNANETKEYIYHRLKVVGAVDNIFTTKAIQAIHKITQGVPSRINVLCHQALSSGAAQQQTSIDHRNVAVCVQKLHLPVTPSQADFDRLVANSSSQVSFEQKDTNEVVDNVSGSSVSGFSVDQGRSGGWLKYGMGLLAIAVAGVYFWYPQERPEEMNVPIVEIVEQESEMPKVTSVSSSPAVTVLEENEHEIDKEKAAQLKNAILEKAYSDNESRTTSAGAVEVDNNDITEVKNDISVDVKVATLPGLESDGELVKDDGDEVLADNVSDGKDVTKVDLVPEKIEGLVVGAPVLPEEEAKSESLEKTIVTEVVVPQPTDISSQPMVQEVVEVAEVEEKRPPLEPRKISLALRPSSLKLTRQGARELESFVQKLKLYPRATILVKGFVSSTSNSPENIKLSEDRANSVQKLLLEKGVDSEQIEVVGMGNKEAIASNTTSEGRRKNRRVEIVVISDGS